MKLRSLSIDFGVLENEFLGSLEVLNSLKSIKLRQALGTLPGPAKLREMRRLMKLHLVSTGLTSEQLEVLQNLDCLEYLRIKEDGPGFWDGYFSVQIGGFPSLLLLSFEAPRYPRVRIQQGAMVHLISLQLLCAESPSYSAQKEESPPYCTANGEF